VELISHRAGDQERRAQSLVVCSAGEYRATSYIDGFIIAVPHGNKQKFIEHAKRGDSVFIENGASRVLECWSDDVKDGRLTDFRRAVQAKDDEAVVFSWIEWPNKATRDTAMVKVMNDPRLDPRSNPMPFDGKRMIFGGFAPILELGASTLRRTDWLNQEDGA
jgi:uncharacterized protein YbaA (DUF1428 family)